MSEFQYFYRVTNCKAESSDDADCICWHDKGTGPLAGEETNYSLTWRAKPADSQTKGLLKWRPADEIPKNDSLVWVIERHWKRDFPRSFRITGGRVVVDKDGSVRIENVDYLGCGLQTLTNELGQWHDQYVAWAYAEELQLIPDFLKTP